MRPGVAAELQTTKKKYNDPCSKLQEKRIQAGFSQSQMAKLLGITPKSYIWLEKHHMLHQKSLWLILRLCEVLDCTASELIDNEEYLEKLEIITEK